MVRIPFEAWPRIRERILPFLLPLDSEVNDSPIFLMALASIPTMLTVLISLLINNSRLNDLGLRLGDINSRLTDMDRSLNARIDDLRHHMDVRFDEMRSTWQAELRRVEEVLDARLKHLEER